MRINVLAVYPRALSARIFAGFYVLQHSCKLTIQENQIDSGLRVARSMAVLLADEGEVSQERYSKFASEISAYLTGIIDIA